MSKDPKLTPDWTPDPFPEPRTVPEGWVGDTFNEKRMPVESTAEDDWKPEPFPEPRMFPWDKGR